MMHGGLRVIAIPLAHGAGTGNENSLTQTVVNADVASAYAMFAKPRRGGTPVHTELLVDGGGVAARPMDRPADDRRRPGRGDHARRRIACRRRRARCITVIESAAAKRADVIDRQPARAYRAVPQSRLSFILARFRHAHLRHRSAGHARRRTPARRRNRRCAGRVSVASDHADRSVPARRRRRHRRPAVRRRAVARVENAGRHREQAGRRRRHRHGRRRQSEARRLHAAAGAVVDLDPARGGQGARPRAAVPARPVHADRAAHRRSDRARRARRQPVEDAAGFRRGCAKAARRDHVRILGQLRHDAHADGNVRAHAPTSSCCTCRSPVAAPPSSRCSADRSTRCRRDRRRCCSTSRRARCACSHRGAITGLRRCPR